MMNGIAIRYVCLLILSLLLQTWNYLIRLSQELQLVSVLPRRFRDVGELMEKYVNLETFKDFDDKLFSAQNMTTIYTFADLTDYDPKIHPFTRGCLEVFRYGNHSTLQRVTDYKGKIFVRAINAGSSTWSQWVQV